MKTYRATIEFNGTVETLAEGECYTGTMQLVREWLDDNADYTADMDYHEGGFSMAVYIMGEGKGTLEVNEL